MPIIRSLSAADTALCISTIVGYVVTLTLAFLLHKRVNAVQESLNKCTSGVPRLFRRGKPDQEARALGGAREARALGGAREARALGGAREARARGGAREARARGGAREPAETKTSWAAPAKKSWAEPAKKSSAGPAETKKS